MSISVNGQSQVPPGFRFHPTEEELLQYYLKKKVCSQKIDLDVIQDVDLNKLEPWDIQEKCKIGSTPQNDWYFFSHKDKKYPTGTRTNRATASGFWKATGRDKVIYGNSRRIGMRKTLVFYKGRAPRGQKSDWIMHEYRLMDDNNNNNTSSTIGKNVRNASIAEVMQEEGWVVCRVFMKRNLTCRQKIFDRSPMSATNRPIGTTSAMISSCDDGTLEQMLQSMGRNHDSPDNTMINRRFLKLPSLHDITPNSSTCTTPTQTCYQPQLLMSGEEIADDYQSRIQDWTALDKLVASHLNGQSYNINNNSRHSPATHEDIIFEDSAINFCNCVMDADNNNNILDNDDDHNSNQLQAVPSTHHLQKYEYADLWSFGRSSNDHLCHLSN